MPEDSQGVNLLTEFAFSFCLWVTGGVRRAQHRGPRGACGTEAAGAEGGLWPCCAPGVALQSLKNLKSLASTKVTALESRSLAKKEKKNQ